MADAAGFCFGVKRALDLTLDAVSKAEASGSGTPIHTLGPLIHNPQVVQELESKGVAIRQAPEDINSGVVIVRCHGVSPTVMDALSQRDVQVLDATCPFVQRAMRWARQLYDEGYQVVIVGDESHPEVQAIQGYTNGTAYVVDSPQAIDELPAAKRIGVIAQTTQSTANFRACISALIGKVEELKAFDTICTATEQRQASARRLAAQVDVMVVIGGHNSANTRRLAEVCQEQGTRTIHVETPDQLRKEWFTGVRKAGVTAGASTPDWLIEGVLKRMMEFTEEKVAQVTEGVEEEQDQVAPEASVEQPEATAEAAQTAQTEEPQMEDFEVKLPTQGDVIKGRVVRVSPDEVLVDIDYKSEGRIPLNELSFLPNVQPADVVSEGDEISVKVLKVEDSEGTVLLSKKRADADQSWQKLQELQESGGTLKAKVMQTVKGGLLVDVGVRGFIPASHVSRTFEDNLDKYVGQVLELKIIELDRSKNNVVFSHKEVLEEKFQRAKEEAFNNLKEGAIVDGVVRRITDFGAFVDIGSGVEGLLHVSEMAYSRVSHPSDVLSEGDEIRVMVLGIDKESERISLGLKQTLPDPWDSITEKYAVGDVVTGTVTRVVDFGAFVKLEDGVEGLVHISQLSHKHVAKTEDVVNPGDSVQVKVISVDPDARRIGLSIKELEPKPEPKPAPKAKQVQEPVDEGNEDLTTNLGDMFGDLFKQNK
ncbi:MAG: bifunctional 4-hydroxy-3-methylbut-2-enyl diphosphate reductase/30S ribosomal protein S1 [Firmicutes bacterium]|nr:bifunctional 4-hydroxy-3-methylbut-2-enyl diphosphate reductase/30S ribosomal protein S1 [Bacillota bacterium]